jgi:broad specificity phosphatase PhoE
MASLREHGEEAAPLLEGRARSSTSRYASRVVLASALAVFGVLVLASASPQGVGARLGGSERPSSRVFLGQAKELNATSVIDELEKALPLSDEAVDLTESVQPFIAMEGMFAYDSWSQNLVEENQDDRPLLQDLENYGATVDWASIRSAINTGLGAVGRRKLFLFIRHGKAMHNAWGMIQHHTEVIDDIPCDYKAPGDLVDPDLTEQGKQDSVDKLHDVFYTGLSERIGGSAKFFTSPLSRCMETTLVMLKNQSSLKIQTGKVTVSELLRERIDARVPFELRRPVSFDPEGEGSMSNHWMMAKAKAGSEEEGNLGYRFPPGHCFVPSKGLGGHTGACCVNEGLWEKFGHYDLFDIKVATPALNNVEVTQGPLNLSDVTDPDAPLMHASCGLMEVASQGWEKCTGPEMLGLLAEDDLSLGPGHEEQESALVERVRTWFASVFDEVDENVIVAVTHSDWIKLALRYLDVRKPWVVPRNSEIFPVIVEDVRTSIPGWKKRRDAEKEDIKKAEADDTSDIEAAKADAETVAVAAVRRAQEAAQKAAEAEAAAQRAAEIEAATSEMADTAAEEAAQAKKIAVQAVVQARTAKGEKNKSAEERAEKEVDHSIRASSGSDGGDPPPPPPSSPPSPKDASKEDDE